MLFSMLPAVTISPHCCAESTKLESYRGIVDDSLLVEIETLSRKLSGLRVCHVNATAEGGGVAELLFRLIPVYRALGLNADWRIIHGDAEFYRVTKSFHNGLQGADIRLTEEVQREYLQHNEIGAADLDAGYDVYFVHDPQPAAIRSFKDGSGSKWIWRCHIDSSAPNPAVWRFLKPYIERYDASVFTLAAFRPPDLRMQNVVFIAPAIDPHGTKNMELPIDLCRRVIADAGINLRNPMILQVARFDPWKDPLGVLSAYRLVKSVKPGVQLVLIGAMAGDDPEGWGILHLIQEQARVDANIHVLTNLTGVGSMEVNAFQRAADVILQKSTKEGFGLVVSEALWKSKPIVAGKAGGIPLQFPSGYERFLVADVEQCAAQVSYLLDNPAEAAAFGRAGREQVRRNFLLPRLVRDELKLMADLVG